MRPGRARCRYARRLEPATVLRHRKAGRPAQEHPGRFEFLRYCRERYLARGSWIVPNKRESEHAPASISDGQAYVTGLINALMNGPDWQSTAIFWPGTTGAASTIMSSRRRWTRMTTALEYRLW